jgi:hypothetical protein
MFANLFLDLFGNPSAFFSNPITIVIVGFQIWMLVDSLRRQEWFWAICIFLFSIISAILYYFMVYRASKPVDAPTFELPGAATRRRIKELEDQIHHLDKAHHHSQLADIYFSQGKLAEAEKEYRAALERDGDDEETLSHYGQCLLRLKRPNDALPLLQKVCAQNPDHEYGQTMMTLGETLAELGQKDAAIAAWKRVLERHSYAAAKVHLSKLLIEKGDHETARRELNEVIADAGHVPAFQRSREKPWVNSAKALLKTIPG